MKTTGAHATGQITATAAQVYEAFFVPALFDQWPSRVVEAACIGAGDRVLDVACGTGVLARSLAARVGAQGSVTGLDLNDGMLEVASRKAPQITWRQGRAEQLPFENERFDAVVSQFGLMFFADRRAALQEMMRVLRPGGRLAVAVWDALDNSPGLCGGDTPAATLVRRMHRRCFASTICPGRCTAAAQAFMEAGIADFEIATHAGAASFPSIQSWITPTSRVGRSPIVWTMRNSPSLPRPSRLCKRSRQRRQRCIRRSGAIVSALKP